MVVNKPLWRKLASSSSIHWVFVVGGMLVLRGVMTSVFGLAGSEGELPFSGEGL
jgi:hypothetical protein